MQPELYLALSAMLLGIGVGAALYRRNIIMILLSICTAGAGAIIAMATIGQSNGGADGMLFALCLGAALLVMIVMGSAIAYRRFMANGTTNVGDGNRLRH